VAFYYKHGVLNDSGHATGPLVDFFGARYKMILTAIHKLDFAVQLINLLCGCTKKPRLNSSPRQSGV
jgi:hypothetical protein